MSLMSKLISADGVARAGYGKLSSIHGACTTAGVLKLYDGADATGPLVCEIAFATGQVTIDPDGSWRFRYGVFADFTGGLAGSFTLIFV